MSRAADAGRRESVPHLRHAPKGRELQRFQRAAGHHGSVAAAGADHLVRALECRPRTGQRRGGHRYQNGDLVREVGDKNGLEDSAHGLYGATFTLAGHPFSFDADSTSAPLPAFQLAVPHLSWSQARPGDLVLPEPGHVVLMLADNLVAQASRTADVRQPSNKARTERADRLARFRGCARERHHLRECVFCAAPGRTGGVGDWV